MKDTITIHDLPVGANPPPPEFPHFPTVYQAVIWRNWELVPLERLAKVLGTVEESILNAASELGLPVPGPVNPNWLERGYITIIRANWHLLPYEQLLELLGWTAERLAWVLEFDDGVWTKLGSLKPANARVTYQPLTGNEREMTRRIRDAMKRYFPLFPKSAPKSQPFDFLEMLARLPARDNFDKKNKKRRFTIKFAASYLASYGELMNQPKVEYFPDGLLAKLAETGANGIWLPVMLRSVYPWSFAPEYAEGWEERLTGIRAIAEKARRYGMELFVYLNEPRYMPIGFFERHPQLKGIELNTGKMATLCSSTPEIQAFLREGTAHLFKQIENLGGVFTITMSESPTNCYSLCKGTTNCPRCAKRAINEVVAEVNTMILEGARSVRPDARVIAWNWAWDAKWAEKAIDLLPSDAWLMSTSEWGKKTNVGGVPFEVTDYSISQVGPSERSLKSWNRARTRGLKTMAKVQINNSWECATVPYIPVPHLIDEHLRKLEEAGIEGLMLCWTCGGWPGGNMELIGRSLQDWLADFGDASAVVDRACREFSAAFRELPFSLRLAYSGPQNVGPKNLLFAKPSGYRATMTGIPFDTLERWRGAAADTEFYPNGYPEEVFEAQFKRLTGQWQHGLEILRKTKFDSSHAGQKGAELYRMAQAVFCLLRSSYLQICFIRRRARMEHPDIRQELLNILKEEITLACRMHELILEDSRIGFEAANHYFFTANDMREKVLNCLNLQEVIGEKQFTRRC